MSSDELKISAVMHAFPHAVGIDQPLSVAKEMMRKHGIRHLPVQKGGQLVGILSDRDINYALATIDREATDISVEDSCTPDPYVVEPDVSVEKVARYMASEQIGCALIAEKSKLLGIFTTVDVCRVLADSLAGKLIQ